MTSASVYQVVVYTAVRYRQHSRRITSKAPALQNLNILWYYYCSRIAIEVVATFVVAVCSTNADTPAKIADAAIAEAIAETT